MISERTRRAVLVAHVWWGPSRLEDGPALHRRRAPAWLLVVALAALAVLWGWA